MKNYFSHDYNATLDPKIIALLGDYGAIGYGIYWRIVEMLHAEESHTLPLKDYIYKALAKQMSTSVEQVSSIVSDCINIYDLFIACDDCFYSKRVNDNIQKMEETKEKRSKAGKISAEIRKNSTHVEQNLTSVQQNLTQSNKRKEKKRKEKKINKNILTIDERKNVFKEKLKSFLDTYSRDMLNDFYLYWTEHNPDGKKMRFEKQEIFDIKRRLTTWNKNSLKDKKFTNQSPTPLILDTADADKARRLEQEYLESLKI